MKAHIYMKLFASTLLILCAMLIQSVAVSDAQENPTGEALTPAETVDLWNTCYGAATMDACGDITTANMRDNKPKSVWVYDSRKILNGLEQRKDSSEIIKEKIDGDTAMIIVQSRIYTVGGYADQKELFALVKVDGVWLIDDLVVGDEILEDEKQKDRL